MEWTLWWSAGCVGISCVVHAQGRFKARQRLGEELCSLKGSMAWAYAYQGLAVGALAWVLSLGALPWLPVTLLLALSVGAVTLSFSAGDQACGTDGVRSGVWALSYSDLEEWRLTGEHLRFRYGGVWRAVMIPAELQGPLRSRLEEVSGGSESRFKR
jgi:hypothetical protein